MARTLAFLILAFASSLHAADLRPPELTTLTSADGQVLKGRIIEGYGESIVIQLPDSRKFTLAWDRFNADSQKKIAITLLTRGAVTPEPEIDAEYFEPAGDPNVIPANTYVRIGRSKDEWWARLHVGDFSEKPATFTAVEFRNGNGVSLRIELPENCVVSGSVRGGKRWTAQEFSLASDTVDQLLPIVKDASLRGKGIQAGGKEEELDPETLVHLGETLELYRKIKDFAVDIAFLAKLPPFEDRSSDLFLKVPKSLTKEDFVPAAFKAGNFRGKVERFSRGLVQTVDGDQRFEWRIEDFQPDDQMELVTRLLETNHKNWFNTTDQCFIFIPSYCESSRDYYRVPGMQLSRAPSDWASAIWPTVPITKPWGEDPDRIRVFIDDQPGFALTSPAVGKGQATNPQGDTVHYRIFRGSGLSPEQFTWFRNAHRVRFEVVKGSESVWVEARPAEIEQMRNAIITHQLMQGLRAAGVVKARPFL